MAEAWLKGLNEQQQAAVTAPLGHLLVLAGAGSGKTRVLVNRIAWLVEQAGLSPHAILAVTFTNKAAGEMKERLSHLLHEPLHGLWVGTFHGLCHRFLRRHFQEANLPEQFHILDSDDQARMIKRVLATLNLDTEQWPIKQAQAFINSQKDEGLRAHQVQVAAYGPGRTLVRIYAAYEQACQQAGVVDFAELMLKTVELLRNNPQLLSQYQARFQALLVDEFQDTNTIQYVWIRLLTAGHTAVMVVGDDDQSIYGWRGAKIENIQRFAEDFAPVTTIRLEQNYRSTSTILQAANALIAHNQNRLGKALWTTGQTGDKVLLFSAFNELEEARFVAERIALELQQGFAPNDIAVLYRSNAQSRVLEEALLRAEIAYRIYGGVRFFERAEIKDTLAYLRLIVNPLDDAAFERVINFPTRGIGEKTLDEIRHQARATQQSLWQVACQILEHKQLPARAASALNQFMTLIEQLRQQTVALSLDEQIQAVLNQSGLYTHFAKIKNDQGTSKLENLQELINAAKQFRYEQDNTETMPLLIAFLAHASLEAGELQASQHERYVHMMTLHAAKGLEFPLVFLVGMEEGVFPAAPEPSRIEEERRLCYVGMTRAMQKLIISYAEIRRKYGREEYHQPSRFLRELPLELVDEIRSKARFQMPMAKKQPSLATNHDSGLRLGQFVMHQKFGQGTVLAIEGSGARTRVQVRFNDEHGTKWLVVAYANLSYNAHEMHGNNDI